MKKILLSLFIVLFPFNLLALLPTNIESYFNNKYKNCFLLKKIGEKKVHVYGKAQCNTRKPPYSTFKILNSLIALETGVVVGNKTVIPWDKKKKFLKVWERDHNLASAIKYSVVPFYQEIARRIGKKRMQKYISLVGYGNNKIGNIVDRFWLDGPLEITAYEQFQFIEKLYKRALPFKKSYQDLVIKNIILDQKKSRVLSGKTGSEYKEGRFIFGWFVGHIKKGKDEFIFVVNSMGQNTSGNKVKKKANKLLLDMNI